MKTASNPIQSNSIQIDEPVLRPRRDFSSPITISEHVRTAVEGYIKQINGHPICNLYELVVSEVERPLIETVLEFTGHNQTKAAKTLGISRSTLRSKMKQHGID